jgi:hypothetical protein
VPRVLRFFLSGFFGIFLPRLQMDPQLGPAAQGSGANPCGVRFYKSHLHISFGFATRQAVFEDLRRQFSRTLGTTREDFKNAQTSAGVHSSLGMLRLLLRTLTCSTRGRLRTACYGPSRLLEAILLDYKVLGGLSYGPPWAHYLGGY